MIQLENIYIILILIFFMLIYILVKLFFLINDDIIENKDIDDNYISFDSDDTDEMDYDII